jgi:hypothetical protein
MIEVLTHPNKFFEARMKGEESLKIPVLIVLITGIIYGISASLVAYQINKWRSYIFYELLVGKLPIEAAQYVFGTFEEIAAFISGLIFLLILWVVFAAIAFGISCIFKGKGKFKRTLEFVGYGYIPLIIGGLISAIFYTLPFGMYSYPTTMSIPQGTDPIKIVEIIIASLLESPMMWLFSAICILFTLWSAYIGFFGMKHARNLSTRDALLSVTIPVAICLYVLLSLTPLGMLPVVL